MSKPDLLNALMASLGPSRIRTDEASLTLLACDAMHPSRLPGGIEPARPLCVVSPRSAAQVQEVVRLANTHRVPVVPLGGGSGLMGGAASVAPGVVLDLCRLAEVRIRPADRMAEAGAGATIAALNAAAKPHGLMCGHDPWTVSVATVGGTIATNSLGYLGGKYGAMGDQVLGLEAVLPSGEIVTTRAVEKASTGPSLHHLLIGAEGCFGVVTRATLRLFPIPQARLLEGWEFDDFAAGFEAINALLHAGIRPGLLEYGDDDPSADYDPPASLYVSYEGPQAVARAEAQAGRGVCRQRGGQALDPFEVQYFWDQRHASGDAYAKARRSGERRGRPEIDYVHVALPPSAVPAYRRESLKLLATHGFHVHQTGLWAHAGLFSLVYAGGVAAMAEAHARLLELAQDADGAMEYCHGVGLRLAPLMRREHGSGLAVLRRVKRELDPNGILNPGKLGL
jgi:FAD/FMN-containing dehydrogenase